MNIIGWIRQGDKASCGGTVVEGDATCTSHGRPLTYLGASLTCRKKKCVIAEAHPFLTLPSGKPIPHHMHHTSGGCPLISTLNGVHGVDNESEADIPEAVVPDGAGGWRSIKPPPKNHDNNYDEYFILMDEETGVPARNRFYRITLSSGETIEGYSDDQGCTQYAAADVRMALSIEVGPQQEIQI